MDANPLAAVGSAVGPLTPAELATRMLTLVDSRASWDLVQNTSTAAPRTLTYRFETSAPPDNPWTDVSGFVAYTEEQKAAVRDVLAEYARVLNVVFVEMTGAGDPNISLLRATNLYNPDSGNGSGRGRWRATLSPSDWDGAIVIRSTVDMAAANQRDLLLHEIGHALGLRHPGPYDVNPANNPPPPYLPTAEDSDLFTVMSYYQNPDSTLESRSLMVYDIAALQSRWGANPNHAAGNNNYTAAPDNRLFTIWDGGGADTLFYSGSASAILDLRPGAFSSLGALNNVSIAYGAILETAEGGSGNDTLTGNDAANYLTAGSGNDSLEGGAGDDTLVGGNGVDTLLGGDGNDTLHYDGSDNLAQVLGGNGTDTFYVLNVAAPTWFDLPGHQFEAAIVFSIDLTPAPWMTRADYYTASWQLYQAVVTNDNNTSEVTTIDIAGAQPWSQAITYANASGQTTHQSIVNDNGSTQTNYFDPTNVQPWSQAPTYYNAAGQTTHQSILNDDGTSRTTYFDPTNQQPWASADTFYDVAGQTTLQSVANDNGTSQTQYWDTTNAQPWSTVIHYYNVAGTRTLTTGLYDNGTPFSY